jgi:hypothetical protein
MCKSYVGTPPTRQEGTGEIERGKVASGHGGELVDVECDNDLRRCPTPWVTISIVVLAVSMVQNQSLRQRARDIAKEREGSFCRGISGINVST